MSLVILLDEQKKTFNAAIDESLKHWERVKERMTRVESIIEQADPLERQAVMAIYALKRAHFKNLFDQASELKGKANSNTLSAEDIEVFKSLLEKTRGRETNSFIQQLGREIVYPFVYGMSEEELVQKGLEKVHAAYVIDTQAPDREKFDSENYIGNDRNNAFDCLDSAIAACSRNISRPSRTP